MNNEEEKTTEKIENTENIENTEEKKNWKQRLTKPISSIVAWVIVGAFAIASLITMIILITI